MDKQAKRQIALFTIAAAVLAFAILLLLTPKA
jgi:hypothetical protein